MLDGGLDLELDFAAVNNVQIMFSEHNVEAFPDAMARCNLSSRINWLKLGFGLIHACLSISNWDLSKFHHRKLLGSDLESRLATATAGDSIS